MSVQFTTLAKEGQLSKACSALLQALLSEKLVKKMRFCHLEQKKGPVGRSFRLHWSHSPRSPSKKPSFRLRRSRPAGPPPTTHHKGVFLEYIDELMSYLHSMVRLMAEGDVPAPITSWIASASLAALKKNESVVHTIGRWLRNTTMTTNDFS